MGSPETQHPDCNKDIASLSPLLHTIQSQVQPSPIAKENIAEQVALKLQQLEVGNVPLDDGRVVAAAGQIQMSRHCTGAPQSKSWGH